MIENLQVNVISPVGRNSDLAYTAECCNPTHAAHYAQTLMRPTTIGVAPYRVIDFFILYLHL